MKLIQTVFLLAAVSRISHAAECAARCEYNGKEYLVGDSFPSTDGCNTCNCAEDGSVACTKKGCPCNDCVSGGIGYCAGDTFKDVEGCNDCSCDEGGLIACTAKYCMPICTSDTDCYTTTRGCSADGDKLCTCVARGNDEIYDECKEGGQDGDTGRPCVCARCASDPCTCYDAVCDGDTGRCALSLKPIPGDNEVSGENPKPFSKAQCKGKKLKPGDSLERGEALCRKTQKGIYQFGLIWDGDLAGTLHLLKVNGDEVEEILWSLRDGTDNDGLIKGGSLNMQMNGNLALYEEEVESCGGIAGIECEKGLMCYTGISNDCDEDCGAADCLGECRMVTKTFCGGIAGLGCPAGSECVDEKGDQCSPNCGGADCGGICLSTRKGGGTSEKRVWQIGCSFNRGARLVMAQVKRGSRNARIVVKVTRQLNFGKKWWLKENGKETNKC